MFTGFRNFLMRGDVIVVAIGLVVALAFSGLVKAFTDFVINPIIAPRELSGSGGAYTPQRPVSAEPGASGRSGDVAPVPFTPTPMPSSDSGASLMSYARPLVASVLAGTILALIGAWWMSGRRRRGSFAPASAEIEGRREPTFDRPAAGLTAGTPPSLTATRPGRR